ncbi:MAG: hypothetical protein HY598_05445 [Candidatus Omnitrophica bacterium]|nr:hypothetical protein [Candidatus Omnitrophota bacterium]
MNRSVIATIRFSRQEMGELARYLRRNAYFDSISSLGRVATMEFVRTRKALALQPSLGQDGRKRPWFLWDYGLTEAQVHELLTHAPFEQRKWLLGRMLERLGPEEIVRYVSLEALQQALPHLRLDEKVKRHWEEAIAVWTHPAPRS